MTRNVEELLKLCKAVINSADDTGCTDDLTVVSKEAVDALEDWITNAFGDGAWRYKLGTGDEVTWNDPDQGLCSKTVTIQTIEYLPDGSGAHNYQRW